ncbi:MAG TPA: VOC family protein [Gemmatimonadales bacterium]|nr:VOC family protein [Gemmatimonadales bacterium]
MQITQRIAPCLWFDDQAEEAANFYTSIFKNSKIGEITRYGEAGRENHQRPPGSVMTVAFELDGQQFTALNGGPVFKFNEAVSFQIMCKNQKEVDYYWEKLTPGGDPSAQVCGWLKDKFGLSWQVVPSILPALVGDPHSEKSQRAMAAMMKMKKLDIAELERAYNGEEAMANK